jgi:D-glycero-D-manno-heptose 1,7-bisphosphate phosphatase
MSMRRAVFLDRDGVIDALAPDPVTGLPESPLRVSDVALLDDVAPAMRALADAGFLLVGVSNQPAAAKATVTLGELAGVHESIIALLAEQRAEFDDFRICWHHPDGSDPRLALSCECRKPAPGMLLDASHAHGIDLATSWTIGDADSDVIAGRRAGTRTVLIEHPPSAHKRTGASEPTLTAADLMAAARLVLALSSR